MCMYCDAKAFDDRMFQLLIENDWADEGLLESAMMPHAGNNNLGTLGIKGNVNRWIALSKVRRVFARKVKLDQDRIGNVKYRAEHLKDII